MKITIDVQILDHMERSTARINSTPFGKEIIGNLWAAHNDDIGPKRG